MTPIGLYMCFGRPVSYYTTGGSKKQKIKKKNK